MKNTWIRFFRSKICHSEIQRLETKFKILKLENINLKSELTIIKEDNSKLIKKCDDHHNTLIKFIDYKDKFSKLLDTYGN